MARDIAAGHLYDSAQYPPLFPAVLAPTLSFAIPYRYAIALMALLSSALVVPVWLTAREIVGVRHAAVVAFLSCLIPFHYTLPRVVMSENLFYPLLVMAGYLVLTTRWQRLLLRDVLTGAVVASLFLTRFMAIIFIPALAIAWLLRERELTGRWRPDANALVRAALLAGTVFALASLWVVSEMRLGASFVETLGLDAGLSPGAVPPQGKSLPRLMSYAALYVASWALWIAPALGLLVLAVSRVFRKHGWDALDRLTALTGLMAVPLLIVSSRHAWKASYNWPFPVRILDRYCIYLLAFGLIIAYAMAVLGPRERRLDRITHWGLGVVAPLVALGLAFWARFEWRFIPVPTSASPGIGGSDTYHVFMMGWWFWPVAVSGIVLVGWLSWRRDGGTVIPLVFAIALFFAIGMPPYMSRLAEVPPAQSHAEILAPLIARTYPDAKRLSLGVSPAAVGSTGLTGRSLTRGLRVRLEWLLHKKVRTYVTQPGDRDAAFTIMLGSEYRGQPLDPRNRYRVDDTEFIAVSP